MGGWDLCLSAISAALYRPAVCLMPAGTVVTMVITPKAPLRPALASQNIHQLPRGARSGREQHHHHHHCLHGHNADVEIRRISSSPRTARRCFLFFRLSPISEICMIECARGVQNAEDSFKIHPTEESVVIQTLNLAKHWLRCCCCSCNKHSIHQSGQRKYGLECSFNQFKQTPGPHHVLFGPQKRINSSNNFQFCPNTIYQILRYEIYVLSYEP